MIRRTVCLIAIAVTLGLESQAAAAVQPTRPEGARRQWSNPTLQSILERIEIGLRFSHFTLLDDSERHFDEDGELIEGYLGSITELKEDQDYLPTLTLSVLIQEWLALTLAYERFAFKTQTYQDGHSDGTFNIDGPSLVAQFRYPNDTSLTPYAAIGVALLSVDFDMVDWWHHGFGGTMPEVGYQEWIDAGGEPWPNGGYERTLSVVDKNTANLLLQAGCLWRVTPHASLNVGVRYLPLDSELGYTLARYGNVFDDRGNSDFPMEVWVADVGVTINF